MDIKLLSIDTIGLSVRSRNALYRAGVFLVGDMMKYSEESLSEIRNLGEKSIREILEKISEYRKLDEEGVSSDATEIESTFEVPVNYKEWILEVDNQEMFIEWFKEKEIKIEVLELLSAKAFNLLLFSGFEYIYQIAFLPLEKLMEIPRMDIVSATEIEKIVARYIDEVKEEIFSYLTEKCKSNSESKLASINELRNVVQYHDAILHYAKMNDIEIELLGLTNRPKNRLLANGYKQLSDIIFMTRSDLKSIPSMGSTSVEEIMDKIDAYFSKNESRMLAVISGDEAALWDEAAIKKMILNLYDKIGFHGLSLNDIITQIQLPEQITIEKIKGLIGQLLAENELEYVDYRCYRVYGKFEDYLDSCSTIDERSREFIVKRLKGETLEAIAQDNNLTRERVRQIVKSNVEKVRIYYLEKTEKILFDEDYYKYLYSTYEFEKKDASEWLGIPPYVWKYYELIDVKQGKKDLQTALEDVYGLDAGLRLKIKNYLNRNKLYIDGMWVEKKRGDLEPVVVRKFCSDDVTFDEFVQIYNDFLKQEEIPYDEKIYYTDEVYRTRKNHLSDARFLLWKQNERLRYYDIDGRDYTELLDILNLDSYEDIEVSTLKFMRDYPEIMKKYDIRDQYELHNLLRKIIPAGSYHDFRCGKMPIIKFGEFDRIKAIYDIIAENAPITQQELMAEVYEEYGFESGAIPFQQYDQYYSKGVYRIDYKIMSDENMQKLQSVLVEKFYLLDEIKDIYRRIIQDADDEEVNKYNLLKIGFDVHTKYAIKEGYTARQFFESILLSKDILDIAQYRKRFTYIPKFSVALMDLKRNYKVIEFEKNQIIKFEKLEQSGVTAEVINQYCNEVYNYVKDGQYFSIKSLRADGFQSELYDLGFGDWFYANLLLSDERFSYGIMFGNIILYKGIKSITIKSFEISLIKEKGCIDLYDFLSEITDIYGCEVPDRIELVYKVQDTEIYYDKILDRLYANKDIYYNELEKGDY